MRSQRCGCKKKGWSCNNSCICNCGRYVMKCKSNFITVSYYSVFYAEEKGKESEDSEESDEEMA